MFTHVPLVVFHVQTADWYSKVKYRPIYNIALYQYHTKTFLERFDKCDNVTWNRSQENVRLL